MTSSESSGGGSSLPTLVGDEPGGSAEPGRVLRRGDTIGRYVVTGELGHGGMGAVYAAHDPELDRKLALKVLHPHARGSAGSSNGQQRMLREARAMARLDHRNVVIVHDVGEFESSVFVAMEFIDGVTLTQWRAAAEQRSWSEILAVFLQAGEGLAAAHEVGLVHRDFKPDNVMIASTRGRNAMRVVVMDFGLARSTAEAEEHNTLAVEYDAGKDERLTQTGALLGTPSYMAPEQHLQRKTSAQTDQFAFCVALHEALFGVRPFPGATAPELAVAVSTGQRVDPPELRRVPARIFRAITRGLRVEPSDRWASMRALLDELAREPARRWRRMLAIGSVPVLALAGAVAIDRIQEARSGSVCAGGESQVAAVWHDERRAAIASALAETGLGHVEDVRIRAERELDAWTSAWSNEYREACEATHVEHVQSADLMDLRMSCLRGRLADVDALLTELAQPTARLVDRAAWAVPRATDLSSCTDVDALRTGTPLPPDAETRAYVDALVTHVASAKAQRQAARTEEARATLESVLARLDERDWPPLRATVLYMLAQVLEDLGDLERAKATMTEAYWMARKSGADRVAAQAAGNLMSMSVDAGPQEVELWQRQAQADLDRIGDDGEDRARLLNELAHRAIAEHDLDHAAALHREALPIWERLHGPDSLDVAVVEHGLGNVAFLAHDDDAAKAHYGHALAIWRQQLGEFHPQLADGYNALGNLAHRAGRLDDAEREYTAGARVIERAYGSNHIKLVGPLNGLALVEGTRGNHERSLELHERMVEIAIATHGEDHLVTATALANTGEELVALGRPTEALERHRRALAIRERTLAPDHPQIAESLDAVARDLLALDRPAEAEPLLVRALEIALERPGRDDDRHEDIRRSLARAQAALRAQ